MPHRREKTVSSNSTSKKASSFVSLFSSFLSTPTFDFSFFFFFREFLSRHSADKKIQFHTDTHRQTNRKQHVYRKEYFIQISPRFLQTAKMPPKTATAPSDEPTLVATKTACEDSLPLTRFIPKMPEMA